MHSMSYFNTSQGDRSYMDQKCKLTGYDHHIADRQMTGEDDLTTDDEKPEMAECALEEK